MKYLCLMVYMWDAVGYNVLYSKQIIVSEMCLNMFVSPFSFKFFFSEKTCICILVYYMLKLPSIFAKSVLSGLNYQSLLIFSTICSFTCHPAAYHTSTLFGEIKQLFCKFILAESRPAHSQAAETGFLSYKSSVMRRFHMV